MATTTDNMQTLAAAWKVGVENVPIIVDLIKDSNLLQTTVAAKASHGIKHRFRYFNSLPTAVFREIGEAITPQKIDTNNAQIDLKELVFDLYDDYQAILQYPGGRDQWLKDNYPAALAGMANALAKAVFYGYDATFGYSKAFKGLHQYAKDLSQVIAKLGGADGSRTTIFATRWDEFNGASLRYNNTELLSVIDMTPNQPVPIVTDTTNNTQLNVFKWIFSSYFALVVPSKKSVAAITQVDSTHGPTVNQMNALVSAISSPSGKKAIYTSALGAIMIDALKDSKYNMLGEADYDNAVASWRKIPIFIDENISEAETTVLD